MLIICDEMKKFRKLLNDKNIPWIDKSVEYPTSDRPDSEIVIYICRTHFTYLNKKWSVINGFGTWGGYFGINNDCLDGTDNLGLLEIMEYDCADKVKGYLTAKEAWDEIEERTN